MNQWLAGIAVILLAGTTYAAAEGPLTLKVVDSTPTVAAAEHIQLKVGEKKPAGPLTLRLVRVLNDSRCPEGVMCVWAGTVEAELEIREAQKTYLARLYCPGKPVTTHPPDPRIITFIHVVPAKRKPGVGIAPQDYQLTFKIEDSSPTHSSPDLP